MLFSATHTLWCLSVHKSVLRPFLLLTYSSAVDPNIQLNNKKDVTQIQAGEADPQVALALRVSNTEILSCSVRLSYREAVYLIKG